MGYSDWNSMDAIVGKKIVDVRMDERLLVFVTNTGERIGYQVYGDCCSHSYFYDFTAVEKLLVNGPVKSWDSIELGDFEEDWERIQVYGFEIVTEHQVWGDQTTVFSFRNSSNGYYGGWMEPFEVSEDFDHTELPQVQPGIHTVD